MKYIIVLFALIANSCTFLPEMYRVVDEVRANKGAITSMEFSESGEELVFVSSNAAYICHVDSTAHDTRVSFCERLALRNGMPTTTPSGGKSITALLQRMKDASSRRKEEDFKIYRKFEEEHLSGKSIGKKTYRKDAPLLIGSTVFSLDGRSKSLRLHHYGPLYEVQRDGSVLRCLRDSDYTGMENPDNKDYYCYAYLSPTGRYGYFVFPTSRRYAWDYTNIRAIPCPEWTVYKSVHVLADLESGQILDKQTSGRNKCSIVSGDFRHTAYEQDFLSSRTIVAIHEKRGLIAVFDRAKGALSIRRIPGANTDR